MEVKGVSKKCKNSICVKGGLPIKNSYKTDPPKTLYNFSEKNIEIRFLWKISPKWPKNSPKKDQNPKNDIILLLSC